MFGQTAVVKDLAGETLAQISPIPATVAQLKQVAMDQSGIPVNLQKIIRDGCVLEDCEDVPLDALDLTLLLDETPLYQWDIRGNPDWSQLCVEGSSVQCPELRSDFVNVMTQEPLSKGVHYIQFVMHHIGDEQWCGVVIDKSQAGRACGGRSLRAWSYYCGRQGTARGSLRDGKAALHACGSALKEFAKPRREGGDVIGMLVDLDVAAVAFDFNGTLQGACAVPREPLHVFTHVDTRSDHVELRKPSLEEAPPSNFDALKNALLEVGPDTVTWLL